MQVAREMAARNNLVLVGFDTAGVCEHMMREIAAAVEDMLAKYPVALQGVAITGPAAGVAPAVGRGSGAGDGGLMSSADWIVLDRAVVAALAPTEADAGIEAPGEDRVWGHGVGLLYAMVVGEFGRFLDGVGGFRARREAQRALITEYLRVSGARRGDRLARVVAGYRYWRDQLGDGIVSHGRFDPDLALRQAFALVELHGNTARPPAKVLHRHLVAVAQQSIDFRHDLAK